MLLFSFSERDRERERAPNGIKRMGERGGKMEIVALMAVVNLGLTWGMCCFFLGEEQMYRM